MIKLLFNTINRHITELSHCCGVPQLANKLNEVCDSFIPFKLCLDTESELKRTIKMDNKTKHFPKFECPNN
jgi:hypothetical protein